jgi:hypothetical protein
VAVTESDYLRTDGAAGRCVNFAKVAYSGARPARDHQQTHQLHDFAGAAKRLDRVQMRQIVREIDRFLAHFLRSRSVRPISISQSCVSSEASSEPRAVSNNTAPRSRFGSATTAIPREESSARTVCSCAG